MKPNFRNISLLLVSFLLLFSIQANAQSEMKLSGAWQAQDGDQKTILLFQDHYFTESVFTSDKYVMSFGGTFTVEKSQLKINVEFNSSDNDEVTKQLTAGISVKGKELQVTFNNKTTSFQQIDDGDASLAGVWHITDRMQDGNLVSIQRSGTRKTLKVLTGTRFQWFAIDPGTREFMGTGGGTYTFVNGKYTENIEFFSRDNSRVGAKLTFDGSLKDGKWHHSGLSSKGDKIYEVWGRVE